MVVFGQNLCDPPRIYGPVYQTILCGCSVKSFSASAGWNEQSSTLTVELIQDTCVGPRVWWDAFLNRHYGNISDPGFNYPEPGSPVYFRIEEYPNADSDYARGGFEYCGLVSSWEESVGANGNPAFTLILTDPRVVLDNTQVIVNEYPGSTDQIWNLINAYGFVESEFGNICLSSIAGGFGGTTSANVDGAIVNDRGMVWNDVKCAIQTLTSSINLDNARSDYDQYCNGCRLTYVGPYPEQEGYGVLASDGIVSGGLALITNANLNTCAYLIDLTEIPLSANSYRISGPNISLSELISQVCRDAGCDYYCELLPVPNGGNPLKIIKIRVAIRGSQPEIGRIYDFIDAKKSQANEANGGVINYTIGEEVRNEDTSVYLLGAKRLDPYEVTSSGAIVPYWGLDTDGALIQAKKEGGEYKVRIDFGRLNSILFWPLDSQFKWVSELELRAALHSQESFEKIIQTKAAGDLFDHYDLILKSKLDILLAKFGFALFGMIPAFAAFRGFAEPVAEQKFNDTKNNDKQKIYDYVRNFASEYYGKQFLVGSPLICYAVDGESEKLQFSHEPSTDGCWVYDGTPSVLGLPHNSAKSDFFRDEVGKYNPIIRFPIQGYPLIGSGTKIDTDPSLLNPDNYIVDDKNIWSKAEIAKEWYIGLPTNPASQVISFLIKADAPIVSRQEEDGVFKFADKSFIGINIVVAEGTPLPEDVKTDGNINSDSSMRSIGLEHTAILPNAALCPLKNNINIYGPWSVAGLPGQVRVDHDEGFAPWEYGSDQVMEQAAISKVIEAVTQMRKGERGSVTLAGYPNIPLGAELFSVDSNNPPYCIATQKYYDSRIYSVSNCGASSYAYCPMNTWAGSFGPNITDINVQVGEGGFTTEYRFSTYTPQFGRFSKGNADRLKIIGQNRLNYMRNLRARINTNSKITKDVARGVKIREINLNAHPKNPASAHHFLIGNYCTMSGLHRPNINTQNVEEATYAFVNDEAYTKHAIMSLDGLLRPVSKYGDSSLPRFALYNVDSLCEQIRDKSRQSDPPISGYTPLEISQKFLDPLANPEDDILSIRSQTPNSGHDIQVLGRGTSPPSEGWAIKEGEEAGVRGYEDDYRFLALRGPLLIQQWGYDEQSKPIPNLTDNDEDAENGIFNEEGLKDKFLDGWLQKPKTWPVAPLDLRFDRSRGVWTVPQPPRNIHVNVDKCKLSGIATNLRPVYDASGNEVTNKTIKFEWPWSITKPSGLGKIPVYYDNVACKYYAFPVNRLDAIVRSTNSDCAASGPSGPSGPQIDSKYKDIKIIDFMEGFEDGGLDTDECGNNILKIKALPKMLFGNIGSCSGSKPSGYDQGFYSNKLFGGSGIYIAQSGCDAVIHSIIKASGTLYRFKNCEQDKPTELNGYNDDLISGEEEGDPPQTYQGGFSKINFVGRLSTTISGCEVTVSGIPSRIMFSGLPECGSTEDKFKPFHADMLVAGTGITIVSDECRAIIQTTTSVSGVKYGLRNCLGPTNSDNPQELNGYNDDLIYSDEDKITSKFNILKFVGRLSTTVDKDDKCTVTVSGVPSQIFFSGIETCGGTKEITKSPFHSSMLLAGTGIDIKVRGEGDGSLPCQAVIQTILKASGISYSSKTCLGPHKDEPSEVNGYNDDLWFDETGQPTTSKVFETLKFVGRLSTTFDEKNPCVVTVSGAPTPIMVSGIGGCNYLGILQPTEAFHTLNFTFGSGLNVIKSDRPGTDFHTPGRLCNALVEVSPLAMLSAEREGQQFTHAEDGSEINPEAVGPRPGCGPTGPDMEIAGPYKQRKRSKYIGEVVAGNGVGVTSFGCDTNCSMLIFNNHIDYGYDKDCSLIKIGQVGNHRYSADFQLKEDSTVGGGPVDSLNGSLGTEIELSTGGGSWSTTFVKSIDVSYGYIMGKQVVTCVSWQCGTFSGRRACNAGKYWIESIPAQNTCQPPTVYGEGCSGASGASGSTTPIFNVKTANYTASPGDYIGANSSGGSFTITLPNSPLAGDALFIKDLADFTVNNVTVDRNGSTIEGYTDDLVLDIKGCVYTFVYDGGTWEISANLGGDGGTSSS